MYTFIVHMYEVKTLTQTLTNTYIHTYKWYTVSVGKICNIERCGVGEVCVRWAWWGGRGLVIMEASTRATTYG